MGFVCVVRRRSPSECEAPGDRLPGTSAPRRLPAAVADTRSRADMDVARPLRPAIHSPAMLLDRRLAVSGQRCDAGRRATMSVWDAFAARSTTGVTHRRSCGTAATSSYRDLARRPAQPCTPRTAGPGRGRTGRRPRQEVAGRRRPRARVPGGPAPVPAALPHPRGRAGGGGCTTWPVVAGTDHRRRRAGSRGQSPRRRSDRGGGAASPACRSC